MHYTAMQTVSFIPDLTTYTAISHGKCNLGIRFPFLWTISSDMPSLFTVPGFKSQPAIPCPSYQRFLSSMRINLHLLLHKPCCKLCKTVLLLPFKAVTEIAILFW